MRIPSFAISSMRFDYSAARVDPTANIAGLEIKEVRDAIRKMARSGSFSSWTVTDLAKQMNISPTHAEWLTETLVK
jgi:hypothetical protein